MYGGEHVGRDVRWHPLATLLSHEELAPQQALRGGGAHQYHDLGLNRGKFGVQPRTARADFHGIWFFMNAPFAARLPLEVLDDIRDVDFLPVHPGCRKGLIQQSARRPYKRPAFAVLAVARLLADHDHPRMLWPFTKHRLRSIP